MNGCVRCFDLSGPQPKGPGTPIFRQVGRWVTLAFLSFMTCVCVRERERERGREREGKRGGREGGREGREGREEHQASAQSSEERAVRRRERRRRKVGRRVSSTLAHSNGSRSWAGVVTLKAAHSAHTLALTIVELPSSTSFTLIHTQRLMARESMLAIGV